MSEMIVVVVVVGDLYTTRVCVEGERGMVDNFVYEKMMTEDVMMRIVSEYAQQVVKRMKSHVEVIETMVAGEKARSFCGSVQIGVSRNTMKL